jgi:hypothetical protein
MRWSIGVAAVSAAVSLASADVLYSQPNDRPGQASFFSDAVAGQFFGQRMADDFFLGTAGSVESIRWWGGSQNFNAATLDNMASFSVRIYADNAGSVGAELASRMISIEDVSIVDTGTTNLTGGIVYQHEAALSAPLDLSAGRYWVSVGATLVTPAGDAWVWAGSTVGNLINATDFFGPAGYVTFDPTFNDLAFEVLGTPVPAPASAVMLMALAPMVRRRRAR